VKRREESGVRREERGVRRQESGGCWNSGVPSYCRLPLTIYHLPLAVIAIDITNEQSRLTLDRARMRKAVRIALGEGGIRNGRIGLAVVDDPTMARLNGQFLGHEGPTDVLSFLLEQTDGRVEAEVVVSADTAAREAPRHGWTPQEELLLYVIHGALHLVGYDDATKNERARMRRRERKVMERMTKRE
jgi:probable rRNA maturation factor